MGREDSLPFLTDFMNGKVYEGNNGEKIKSQICCYPSRSTQFINQYLLNTYIFKTQCQLLGEIQEFADLFDFISFCGILQWLLDASEKHVNFTFEFRPLGIQSHLLRVLFWLVSSCSEIATCPLALVNFHRLFPLTGALATQPDPNNFGPGQKTSFKCQLKHFVKFS